MSDPYDFLSIHKAINMQVRLWGRAGRRCAVERANEAARGRNGAARGVFAKNGGGKADLQSVQNKTVQREPKQRADSFIVFFV